MLGKAKTKGTISRGDNNSVCKNTHTKVIAKSVCAPLQWKVRA